MWVRALTYFLEDTIKPATIVKIILEKRNWKSTTDSNYDYRTTVVKIVRYLPTYAHINNWNRLESFKTKPYMYGLLIFVNGAKRI